LGEAMLLNEFLKEHRNVAEQQSAIAELKTTVAQQQKQIEALTSTVRKVSDQIALSKPTPRLVTNPIEGGQSHRTAKSDVFKDPMLQIRVQSLTPEQQGIAYRHTYISPWSFTHQWETLPFPSFHPTVDDHWLTQSRCSQAAGSQ